MLVHKFYLVECIGFEFKFEFEFKLVECCLEKKRGRKKPKKEKTNPAQDPNHSRPTPSFPFFSRSPTPR